MATCVCTSQVRAQGKFDKWSIATNAFAITGVVLDWKSTKDAQRRGFKESNPFLQGRDGFVDTKKFWTFNAVQIGGSNLLQLALPRRHRYIAESFRVIIGGAHIVAFKINLGRR
jgi:hypothetical protein